MRSTRSRSTAALIGALALTIAWPAAAQWKWRDDQGRVHYSDQAPPNTVPAASILKQGRVPASGATEPGAPGSAAATALNAAAPADPAGANASPGWADRALQMRKREAEKAEAARKAQEQTKQAAKIAGHCEALKAEAGMLASGMRIARLDARGEQEILGDEERATRLKEVGSELKARCPIS